jgi:8-oxo-dGTP pyrophosphatase MutT (NUDIX family)
MFNISANAKAALEELLETSVRPTPSNWHKVKLGKFDIGTASPEVLSELNQFINQENSEISLIQADGDQIIFNNSVPNDLSFELRVISEYLRDKGLITGWRNEEFSHIDDNGHEQFRLERAAFRTFGLKSRAVHINGYTSNQCLWLAKRSLNKATHPGLLDNIAAGGINADETVRASAIRELWEEAGIPREIALSINPISAIPSMRAVPPRGLHHETLFTFDLFLPEDFTPSNQDGEVSSFELIKYQDALELLFTESITPDAMVVTADFLLRKSNAS